MGRPTAAVGVTPVTRGDADAAALTVAGALAGRLGAQLPATSAEASATDTILKTRGRPTAAALPSERRHGGTPGASIGSDWGLMYHWLRASSRPDRARRSVP